MTSRPDADRCPGVLRPHQAVDGAVLRIRIPGGRITAAGLLALSVASSEHADGDVQLTSRANLQLRGVRISGDGAAAPGLVQELAAAGLLPHPSHERLRNIVCSPLTGLVGGLADLRPLITLLDVTLSGLPEPAALPGPFLFALDDGRGDVGVARADLAASAVSAERVRIWAGGIAGPVVTLDAAPATLIGLARAFCVEAGRTERVCWHVRDLPGGGAGLLGRTATTAVAPAGSTPPLGALGQDDGREVVSVLAPLGRFGPEQVRALVDAARRGGGELIATPWRGVLVPDLPAGAGVRELLTGAGLVADSSSPWRGISACPGTRCARGGGDTDSLARLVVLASRGAPSPRPVHIVACARACGRPASPHVLATVDADRVEIRRGESTVVGSTQGAAGLIAATRAESDR